MYVIAVLGMMYNVGLLRDESNDCSCIGDTLTFECTVMSGSATIWRGSAFNCASSDNEIQLLNNTAGNETCNYGMITGRVIRRQDNNYTTQLNVILSSNLIGKTVECASNNGSEPVTISNTILAVGMYVGRDPSVSMHAYTNIIAIHYSVMAYILSTAVPLPPPDAISIALVDFGVKEITFSWSPVASDCPTVHNNILASNCGSCPTTTNQTCVTCTDIPTDNSMCTFAIQTVVCGNITSNMSKSLSFNVTETVNETMSSNKGIMTLCVLCISWHVHAIIV